MTLLTVEQFDRMGSLLVRDLMLVVKHDGALDKAGMGLTTLVGKLMR
jgi:hypothetical protein